MSFGFIVLSNLILSKSLYYYFFLALITVSLLILLNRFGHANMENQPNPARNNRNNPPR